MALYMFFRRVPAESSRVLFIEPSLARSTVYRKHGLGIWQCGLVSIGEYSCTVDQEHQLLLSRTRRMEGRAISSPIPIHKTRSQVFFPASLGLSTLSPVRERPLTPSPLPSPPSSPPPPSSPSGFLQYTKDALQKAVKKRGSKASNLDIDEDMRDMCYYYNQLSIGEKSEFLLHLAKNLGTNHDQVKELAQSIPRANEGDPDEATAILRWEDRLRQALQPSFHWVTMQISRLSGGVKFLVDLREHILVTLYGLSSDSENQAALKTLDVTLRELLSLWFTVGLLSLQRITWESSCDMLQKVSEYEAVHPVRNWTDLKRRVGNYRRCFVFTHSCMPSEPLVVLHTFLTNEISRSMNKIVQNPRYSSEEENSMAAGEDPSTITTAIFYSITSTQKGLQGIELGHYLIKRVVRELQAELPKISQFSSLSPIPGYTKWLIGSLVKAQRGEIKLFTDCEVEDLQKLFSVHSEYEVHEKLRKSLGNNGWSDDESLVKALEEPLMRLCSHYLYNEKRRGFAFDSVANFHLKNGAVMWRINWKADWSPRGLGNSCGIMVNYRYFLEDCDTNTKKYLENAKINASDPVVLLARKGGEIIRGSTSTSPSSPPPPVITITPDSKM